jgi:DNA modification methylase
MSAFVGVRTRTRPARPNQPSTIEPLTGRHAVIEYAPLSTFSGPNRALRRRRREIIERHAECLQKHGVDLPVLATRSGELVYGHDTLAAYRHLNRREVPVIYVDDRSPAQVKALQLSLEYHFASGEFENEALKDAFEAILEDEAELIRWVGFDLSEIDLILHSSLPTEAGTDDEQDIEAPLATAVTREGDVFQWVSGHRLICGNSRIAVTYDAVMKGACAHLLMADPPFGTAVADISKSHGEWVEGSDMTEEQTTRFLSEYLLAAKLHLAAGALVYNFIDHKGMISLLAALREADLQQKNICTWDKGGGVGSFYMNTAEFVVVAKNGKGSHLFNPPPGFRGTVWSVPGYGLGRPDRAEALANHACTKPQGVLTPIVMTASEIGDIILDPFLGSGSGMLAAERLKRVCYGIEIDPTFVDIAVGRMHRLTGEYPIHEASGLTFDALAAERDIDLDPAVPANDEL